jgi:NADPH-dependent curcumin reductase CurA
MNNKSVILIGRSDNDNKPSPFKVEISKFQPKNDYELILKIKCFSLDPVMRVWMTGA